MKIVVLSGGISTEREVSIVTGTQVCQGLRKLGHRAILLDVFFGTEERNLFDQADYDIEKEAERLRDLTSEISEERKRRRGMLGNNVLSYCEEADVVFMGLHGSNGEDGKIQAMFEMMGIRYTGCGHLGSALAMDKELTRQLLTAHGVPMPKGYCMAKGEDKDEMRRENKVSFPCVVKPACGGSSVGVSIAENEEEFDRALAAAFLLEDRVIVEEYIKGREFSVGVLGGKALPIIEIEPLQGFYDYKNKYEAGCTRETCPANLPEDLSERMQSCAQKVHQVLRLTAYSRMDFLMDQEGRFYCLEANTLPGMTPTSLLPQEAAAVGMNFPQLCEELIRLSMS